DIITKRGRNESTETLKYWKSVGVASPGGRIQDTDFTRWTEYLKYAGIISGGLDTGKLYTNEFNKLDATAPAVPPAATSKG
ncbi:MAG: ABC transporter substrate-binding protein, partial [Pseudarthrobacter sp.]|nr:ABC transporter substrate-binding protein [Pseudarthrobacter sp.]